MSAGISVSPKIDCNAIDGKSADDEHTFVCFYLARNSRRHHYSKCTAARASTHRMHFAGIESFMRCCFLLTRATLSWACTIWFHVVRSFSFPLCHPASVPVSTKCTANYVWVICRLAGNLDIKFNWTADSNCLQLFNSLCLSLFCTHSLCSNSVLLSYVFDRFEWYCYPMDYFAEWVGSRIDLIDTDLSNSFDFLSFLALEEIPAINKRSCSLCSNVGQWWRWMIRWKFDLITRNALDFI